MSHRVIIFSVVKTAFEDPEVRSELTTTQLAKVDQICEQAEPCDEDFRYLARRLTRAYCEED